MRNSIVQSTAQSGVHPLLRSKQKSFAVLHAFQFRFDSTLDQSFHRDRLQMESGFIFNIQKYSLHDGPGIRTTVFLKGCPLCCQWCHNPESISPRREIIVVESRCIACGECRKACEFGESVAGTGVMPPRHDQCTLCAECVDACPTGARQMIGRAMTVAEVMDEVLKDRVFYEDSKGGVTISGGEPLMQPQFVKALLAALREAGVHTALDTTGFGCTDHLIEAAKLADLVLYDLKAFSEQRHRELTGVTNRNILTNLSALNEIHRNVWIRLPFVPRFNDDLVELGKIAELVSKLRCVTLVNLLPFHRSGLHKYERLGQVHCLQSVEIPSEETMERAANIFREFKLPVRIGG